MPREHTWIIKTETYCFLKCKAVLDGEKIIEIRVKTKAQENPQKDASEPKSSDEPKQASAATPQQSE